MHRNNIFLLFVMLGSLFSCIKPYTPDVDTAAKEKYVVLGTINDFDTLQCIAVSKTSPLAKPGFLPVAGCTVTVLNGKGVVFNANELEPGIYKTAIDKAYLIPGTTFSVNVVLPTGEIIASTPDTLKNCPEVDSVYYQPKTQATSKPGVLDLGLQFMLDYKGTSNDASYYRWQLTETWEYHAVYPLEWYFDGMLHRVEPPDFSRFVCWRTQPVQQVFTLSTKGLNQSLYKGLPLHFVKNTVSKLKYMYSLLILQSSLSHEAFAYWDQIRINEAIGEGLYERQPVAIKGNLSCISDPSKTVLGFFGASMVRQKRIFVGTIPDFPIEYDEPCSSIFLMQGFEELTPDDYPAYFLSNEHGGFTMNLLGGECIDCLLMGGTNVKPEFWPK